MIKHIRICALTVAVLMKSGRTVSYTHLDVYKRQDQYEAKNEVLEMEIPQLQEIAGKVWKKEDELKQLTDVYKRQV